MKTMNLLKETSATANSRIPESWGNDVEVFKDHVLRMAEQAELNSRGPSFREKAADGTEYDFYPVFFATAPENAIVSREEIRKIFSKKIVERAWFAYYGAIQTYADHIYVEEYLAWGLENGMFSKEEVSKIRFDHGDTPESYVRDYGRKDLLDAMVDRFIHPQSDLSRIRKSVSSVVDDCCCDC
ncbi:MAG: hypothetical protein QMC36_08390 [Patescibacteria group bacterium]